MNYNQPIKLFIKDNEKSYKWHRFYNLRLQRDDGRHNVVEIERIYDHGTKQWNTKITPISGKLPTLFKGCYNTRLTYKVSGLSNNQIKIINTLFANDHNNLSYIIKRIKEWGGSVTYQHLNNEIYNDNIKFIDSSMHIMLGHVALDSCNDLHESLKELTQSLSESNPLKRQPYFYQYKFKKYLVALILGFCWDKEWLGHNESIDGYIVYQHNSPGLYYDVNELRVFEDILLENTKISVTGCVKNHDQLIYNKDWGSYLDLDMDVAFIDSNQSDEIIHESELIDRSYLEDIVGIRQPYITPNPVGVQLHSDRKSTKEIGYENRSAGVYLSKKI